MSDQILFKLVRDGVDASIRKILDKYSKMLKPKQAAQATMLEIAEIKFGPKTRPYYFMEHFLFKKGEPRPVDLRELFLEDKTVRERVTSEVYRRVLGINTQKELQQLAVSTSMLPQGIDPVITIKQENYSDPNWCGALGTYDLEIVQLIDQVVSKDHFAVTLRSGNVYKWHPDDKKRFTQPIHEFGAQLVKNGWAHNFPMPARSMAFIVDRKFAEAIRASTLKQHDPKGQSLESRLMPLDLAGLGRLAESVF